MGAHIQLRPFEVEVPRINLHAKQMSEGRATAPPCNPLGKHYKVLGSKTHGKECIAVIELHVIKICWNVNTSPFCPSDNIDECMATITIIMAILNYCKIAMVTILVPDTLRSPVKQAYSEFSPMPLCGKMTIRRGLIVVGLSLFLFPMYRIPWSTVVLFTPIPPNLLKSILTTSPPVHPNVLMCYADEWANRPKLISFSSFHRNGPKPPPTSKVALCHVYRD